MTNRLRIAGESADTRTVAVARGEVVPQLDPVAFGVGYVEGPVAALLLDRPLDVDPVPPASR